VTATSRWALYAAVPLLAVAVVSLVFIVRSRDSTTTTSTVVPASTGAAATWAAGEKRAPSFALRDEHGKPLSLAALRGRPVLVTFIDPLCRDYCPTEAQHLNDVVRGAGVKPAVVAVSVNTAGNTPQTLALDRRKWQLVPQWRWGIGTGAELAPVWRAFHVQVLVTRKKIAGVEVQQVSHTEAAYLIDAQGYERALFLWPYTAGAVSGELRALTPSS
jgi:cytochrome oxidase Cu insertion factor (SCO1/SenC/PrrC family)